VIRRLAVCYFALLLILLAAAPLLAQAVSPFSADMKFASAKGVSGTGKLYFSGDKVRMEMSAQGHDSIIISDQSRKIADVLMPQQQMYMEMSTNMQGGNRRGPDWRAYDPANPCKDLPDTTCQKVGTEMVNGSLCTQWQFTGKSASSSRTVWIDQKTGIPIKTQTADGTTMEITNIKQGPQSPSLFEIPAGYKKFDMGNMMQNMPHPQ
jgi:outer membrane lipoprotein-sorting protein